MKWSERFATGIPSLDQQHQMLFKMSEDFRDALDHQQGARTYGVLLEALHEYARAHFGHEEHCMFRHQCPVARTNSAAHAGFLTMLDSFQRRHTTEGFTLAAGRELVDFVDEWLSDHIGRIDTQLRSYVHDGPSEP